MAKGNKILIAMAAGSGTRMGSVTPKQFLDLGGKPVLRRTIEAFVAAEPERAYLILERILPGGRFLMSATACAGGIYPFPFSQKRS